MTKNKKDLIAIFIFILTFSFIYLFLTKDNNLFASTLDFKYQHYLIPEYFRTLFYDTHDLFPDFERNLGSGQNIYYLSYYGLFNPYILLSYLFPKINFLNYMIIINCLIVITSTILFYFYLRKNHYNEKNSFITAFLFLTSAPLIFHAKRHIMFINYFPFLILGLYGIDKFFEKKKITLLTISIILIVLSSYYFSIPALISLFIYSIYKLLKQKKSINFKIVKQHFSQIIIPFFLGVLSTTFLTLPTLYTLLKGRTHSQNTISLSQLLTPSITSNLLYSHYTIGLTIISLIALIYFALKGKKDTKFLSIFCLLITAFPIFNYILNGTLYINAKSLIPFIPIILILVAEFLKPYLQKKSSFKQFLLITYLLISSFSICLYSNSKDKLLTKQEVENPTTQAVQELINEITKKDTSFYRINNNTFNSATINKVTNIHENKTSIYSSTSNQNYFETYNQILKNPLPNRNKFVIAPSTNLLSQIILNEKYIITKENLTLGYKLINEKNGIKLYQNNNTLPIGYATNNLISSKQFKTISYPNNVLSLLDNIIITNDSIPKKNIKKIEPVEISYQVLEQKNIEITKEKDLTIIQAEKNANITIELNKNMQNKILFLKFQHTYFPNQDLVITINNTKNTLTKKSWKYFNNNIEFNYLIPDTNILKIQLKKGTYKIKNIETFIIDYNDIKEKSKNVDPFFINHKKTKGDKIYGTINITNDNSYFTTSIPYDKGFKILVDGEKIDYQKSATNFITFPIQKGEHQIQITFNAPLKRFSLLTSLFGIILFISYNYKKNTSK